MMFSLKNAYQAFGLLELVLSGFNLFVAFAFVTMFYDDPKQSTEGVMFRAVVISAVLGLVMGLYFKYRSKLSSLHAVGGAAYGVVTMEILFSGSGVGLALIHSGRPELRWFAFNTNAICIVLTLLIGMLLEARRLGLFKGESRWREEIGKYLNYSKRLVDPALTTMTDCPTSMATLSMVGALAVNIPLLFQIYGGGRGNAIFFAAPLMMATFTYVNFTTLGPGLLRVLLLRKIEKEQGFRFLNKDYEEVQRMRHDFAFASSLMNDYDPAVRKANRENRIAMKKRMELQQQKMDAHEMRQKNNGKG